MSSSAPLVADPEAGEMLDDERVLYTAEFDEAWVSYATVSVVLVSLLTVFMLPFLILLPFMVIGFRATYRARRLIITEKTIVYKTGAYGCCCVCWNESSKHVPLEKVTDITYSQGCLQRSYGIASVSIQTAGQNGPDGRPELAIPGIINAAGFRKIVMNAKAQHMAQIYGGTSHSAVPIGAKAGASVKADYGATSGAATAAASDTPAMVAVKDAILRIEQHVARIDSSLAATNTPPAAHV